MTASVPNEISMNELSDFYESATQESAIELAQPDADGVYTEQQIMDVVHDALKQISELIPDPVSHKYAMLKIADNMALWHTTVGQQALVEDRQASGEAWLRDAGKFQAIMDILMSIHLGDNDSWAPNAPE
jgi:hypothetical protein